MAGPWRLSGGRRRLAAWAIILVSSGAILAGCGGSSGGVEAEPGSLAGTDLDQAQRLYAQLKRESALRRDRKALDLAGSLLDHYPTFARNDEVLVLAIESAARLGDGGRALALTDELLGRYPQSPLIDQALSGGAELAAAGRDTLRAAVYMITYHDRDPVGSMRSDATPRAAVYLQALDRERLDELFAEHSESLLWTYLGYLAVEANLAEGRYPEAGDIGAELQRRAPEDRWSAAALELLGAEGGSPRRFMVPTDEVNPDRIGVLVPLTGRYAVLGNAFYEAALMATDAANLEHGAAFELQLEDTAADPVQSALAARRLCAEEGSVALLGGLLSDPTASAAVVCDIYGVPLVSPTATNDNIWKLGPAIFQTNVTGLYEVRLLAELATSVMLKRRFGIIHPDTPEGHRHAQVFTAEIENRGGEIVATALFPPQGTDFKDPILALRKERPEIIFAPASVDQMVLLGPQLDFYRAGSLVFGLSNWNSSKLRDQSETVLERAIFPDDLVMFPGQWETEFQQKWNTETYPPEATALALKAYQATRILLDTRVQSGAVNRRQLADALRRRLANQDLELDGPDAFGPTMRMFRGERIVAFPSGLFEEGWNMNERVRRDSLQMIPTAADTLPEGPVLDDLSGQG